MAEEAMTLVADMASQNRAVVARFDVRAREYCDRVECRPAELHTQYLVLAAE